MHTLGEYTGANRSLEGDLIISFAIPDDKATLESLAKLENKELVIEAKKYSPKRSLNANAYFWKLCTQIAETLGTDKDTIYLLQLKKYGVYEMLEVIKEAVEYIKPLYRLVEIDHSFEDYCQDVAGNNYLADKVALKCYVGSSHYDSKQMSVLIDGTVNDCKDIGIETWSEDEIARLCETWEARE